MRNVRWIFVVLLISSLISFVDKDKPSTGLDEGNKAPDFKIEPTVDEQAVFRLSDTKGQYVLLSFWASYDADSRIQNASLSRALHNMDNIKMVSVSFDEYKSIFKETIRKDEINEENCFVETTGEKSTIFKDYQLKHGFTNYLLDKDGIIIAKNLSPSELRSCINKLGICA